MLFITFTPILLRVTHFPFLMTQLCVLHFPPINQVQLVLSLYSWMCGLPLSVIDLPGAMFLKKIDFPSLRSYYKGIFGWVLGELHIRSLHAEIWFILTSCGACAVLLRLLCVHMDS